MGEEMDWSLTTFDGLRLRQMQEFAALPLREKLRHIEAVSELGERLREGRRRRGEAPTGFTTENTELHRERQGQ